MTKWPLKRGVRLWEVKNVVFVCSKEHDQVSAYKRCPSTGGVRVGFDCTCHLASWRGSFFLIIFKPCIFRWSKIRSEVSVHVINHG